MDSDLESLLIENGSLHKDLWGINIYPELDDEDFIEFDSWISEIMNIIQMKVL